MSDGRARIFILSDFERNDKANDNNYQLIVNNYVI